MIKASLLETAVVHGCTHVNIDNGEWTDSKLRFVIANELDKDLGLMGSVFQAMHGVTTKLLNLELTDVELSILAALLLFCSGKCFTPSVTFKCSFCFIILRMYY